MADNPDEKTKILAEEGPTANEPPKSEPVAGERTLIISDGSTNDLQIEEKRDIPAAEEPPPPAEGDPDSDEKKIEEEDLLGPPDSRQAPQLLEDAALAQGSGQPEEPRITLRIAFTEGRSQPNHFIINSDSAKMGSAAESDIVFSDSRVPPLLLTLTSQEDGVMLTKEPKVDLEVQADGQATQKFLISKTAEIKFLNYKIVADFVSIQSSIPGASHVKSPNLQMQVLPPLPPPEPPKPLPLSGESEESSDLGAHIKKPLPSKPKVSLISRIVRLFIWLATNPIKTFLLALMIHGSAALILNRETLVNSVTQIAKTQEKEVEVRDRVGEFLVFINKKLTFLDFKVDAIATPTPGPTATPAPIANELCSSFSRILNDSKLLASSTARYLADSEVKKLKLTWKSSTKAELLSQLSSYFVNAISAQDLKDSAAAIGVTDSPCAEALVGIPCRTYLAAQTHEALSELIFLESDAAFPKNKERGSLLLKVPGLEKMFDELRKNQLRSIDYATQSIELKTKYFPEVLQLLKDWLQKSPVSTSDREVLYAKVSQIHLDSTVCESSNHSLSRFERADIVLDPKTSAVSFCPSNLMKNTHEINLVHRLARSFAAAIDDCGLSTRTAGSHPFRAITACLTSHSNQTDSSTGSCGVPSTQLTLFRDWVASEITVIFIRQHYPNWTTKEFQMAYANALRDEDSEAVTAPSLRFRVDSALGSHPAIRAQIGCDPSSVAIYPYCSLTTAPTK